MRSCTLKDYKYGDIFDPLLTVFSKQEIVLNEGDAVPVIDAIAKDGMKEITPTYEWDEGAITDGKMNAGLWYCIVTATDANGNRATASIRVTVKGEEKYTITFNGKDETKYAYGDKIEKPEDPTKESTEKYQYTFDGWYFGEEKWDFEHDVVTSDVALTAKFIQSDVYYKVSVKVEGGETQILYLTYGAQVDLAIFNKEGMDKEVKENGVVVTKLIVTKDTSIEISYSKAKSQSSKKGGCSGSAFGVSASALGVCAGALTLRRRRKTDEE